MSEENMSIPDIVSALKKTSDEWIQRIIRLNGENRALKKELEDLKKGVPLVSYEIATKCLEALKPLDKEGSPNTLLALVQEAMREIDYWKYAAAYMAECHAATAEYDGNLKSVSRFRRNRLATICKKAFRFMKRDMIPTWADKQRPIEDTIKRCEEAANNLGAISVP